MTQSLHKSHGGCNVARVFGHFGTRCPSTNFSNNSSAPAHIIYCFIIRLHELQNCSGARQRQGARNDITDNFANLVSMSTGPRLCNCNLLGFARLDATWSHRIGLHNVALNACVAQSERDGSQLKAYTRHTLSVESLVSMACTPKYMCISP
jgi:hypothetical protein